MKQKRTKAKKHRPKRDITYNTEKRQVQDAWKKTRMCIKRLTKKGIKTTKENIIKHTTCFVNEDGTIKNRLWNAMIKHYSKGNLVTRTYKHFTTYHLAGYEPNLDTWTK